MAETTQKAANSRKEQVGYVVSTKMQKTIVVAVSRQRAHPMYRRVVARTKKFYAHDEQNTAQVGDCGAHRGDPSDVRAQALAAERDCAACGAGGTGGGHAGSPARSLTAPGFCAVGNPEALGGRAEEGRREPWQ